ARRGGTQRRIAPSRRRISDGIRPREERAWCSVCDGVERPVSRRAEWLPRNRGEGCPNALELSLPALAVLLEGDETTGRGNRVEAGFAHGEPRATRHVLEHEGDERRRLGRVVGVRVDRVRMPPKGKVALGLDRFDRDGHGEVVMTLFRDGAAQSG